MATHQPGTWYGYGSGDDDDHVRSAPPTGTTYGDQQYQQQPPPAQQDGHVLDDAQYGGYQHATPPPPPQRDDLQPPPPVPPRLDAFDEEETEISHPMLTESQGWLSRLRARIRSCWGGSDPDDEEPLVSEFDMSDAEQEEKTRQGIQLACLLIVALVALGYALIYLSFILIPLVLARFFVYIAQPLINYMVGKKPIFGLRIRLPRWIAVVAVILLVCFVLLVLCLAIYLSIMQLVNHSDVYLAHLQTLYQKFVTWAEQHGYDQAAIQNWLPSLPIDTIIVKVAAALYDLIPQAVLTLLFTIYMLLDYDETHIKSKLQSEVDRRVRKYIVFKTVISLVVGTLVCIILAALNVEMFLLFALLTFLLNFIPNIGSSIATLLPLPIVILDPTQNWLTILLTFLLPASVHMCIGQILEPKLLGKSFEMSPVSVMAVLAFWGGVWGIVGAFMSVPINVVLQLWLQTIPHPMAKFMADLLAGEFNLFGSAAKDEHKGSKAV